MVNIQASYPTIISFFEGLPFSFCMVFRDSGTPSNILADCDRLIII